MSSIHVARQGFVTKSALPSVSRVRGTTQVADNRTVLLLNGNGTNGAQNNTFLDSSTNNFSITRNGNATQGSFSPFTLPNGQWSNFFDGDGDYLNAGSSTDISGDFTIEAWVYLNSADQVNKNIYLGRQASQGTGGLSFGTFSSGGRLQAGASGIAYDVSSTNAIPIRQWVHVAAVRSGSNLRLYINGVNDGSVTQTRTYTGGTLATVGGNTSATNQTIDGYISNLRLVNGTALYNSNFTPATSPLTAVTNTVLLTCQSNRFRDNSTNNTAMSIGAGTPRVTPWSPFAPTSAYSASVNGGSAYFDGTGDYISVPTNSALSFGTGDFTIEFWMYMTSYGSANQNIIDFRGSTGSGTHPAIYLENVSGTGTKQLRLFNGTSDVAVTANNFPLNTWHHIAATRNGTELKFFVNGSQVGSTSTNSTNYTNANGVWIGAYSGNTANYFGYLSNVRVVTGTAVYTANFTPPTAPVTNITNTSLLLNFTNAGIFDTAGDNVIETVGNAQIDTAIRRYGSGSLEFDGTDDRLVIPSSVLLGFGTGDFTIEAWVYTTSTAAQVIYADAGTTRISCSIFVTSGQMSFYNNATTALVTSTGAGLTTNTWNHLAWVRSSGTLRMFANGVQVYSGSLTSNLGTPTNTYVGSAIPGDGAFITGYIDDLRVTRGFARYTANFTPPTAELIVFGTSENVVTNSTYGVYQLA